jgi:hypothetical protein
MANAPGDTGTEDKAEPEYVSKSDLEKIVNSAVTSQLKRSLGKSLSEAIEAAVAPIREQLGQREDKPEKPEKKGDASPEVAAMAATIKKLEDKLGAETRARKESSTKAAKERAYNSLVSELTSSGKLRQEAIPMAADLLFHARGAVKVDDDGGALFRHGEEDLPLSDGVKEFLKSKEAALFMAAPATSQKAPAAKPSFLPAPKSTSSGTQQNESPEARAIARMTEQGHDLKSLLG